MAEHVPHLTLVAKCLALCHVIGEAVPEHLHGQDAAGLTVDGPVDPGERTGPNLIEQFGMAVEIPPPLTPQKPVELESGEEFAPHESLPQLGRRSLRAHLMLGIGQGTGGCQLKVGDELRELFCRGGLHQNYRGGPASEGSD